MVWVRSEYAGELAVLSTWLSAFIPWNVMLSSVAGGSVLFVRFPFLQIRYAYGVPFAEGTLILDPLSAISFQAGNSIAVAYQAWAVGAAVFAVAFVFSILYYLAEARVEALPVDPVRVVGALLGLTGVVLAAATYLLLTRGFPGIPIPLGVVFLLVFGGVLLTIDRTD
ncbi:hypothetical protein C2R22_06580 [Salinigranum rubrum]|uniref:TIGR04206 family protein n=1 Tax=Salinigranum rubrum TaxID=755307 RepID=A0A2I8VHF9_9EURY|nr:hypothetical protein [Salinigranum rubrum]AUV81366.1 hypothetical protein C2R22_06580 [Salinigranum rubrum]